MFRLNRFSGLFFLVAGVILLTAGFMFGLSPQPVEAQCGASASSCKNCHEVNAQHPVNGSGEWHIKHSFGDFCSFCHGGNVQAQEKAPAHQGMYYPLADVKTACATCHPADLNERAQVYAKALGVDLSAKGGANATPSAGDGGTGTTTDASKIAPKPIEAPGETHASGALLDYIRRYNVEVLGQSDTSRTGNTILVIAAIALAVLGGALIWYFEKLGNVWRLARAIPEWRKRAETGAFSVKGPVLATHAGVMVLQSAPPPPSAPAKIDLPKDVQALDPQTQADLKMLLSNPEHGAAILRAISRLDTKLIDNLTVLNKQDRALLLAIVEQLGDAKS